MKKGEVLSEGKTKIIYEVEGKLDLVLIENKDDITKNDDAAQTRVMEGKAVHATTTTCAVFELMKKARLPVAYQGRYFSNSFFASRCTMLPLEVVVRRYGVGSYLKRFPNLIYGDDMVPEYFDRLVVEFFLKTSDGEIKNYCGNGIGATPIDDPLIRDVEEEEWRLMDPKKPSWEEGSDLGIDVDPDEIIPTGISVSDITNLALETFFLLEGAWFQQDCRLIDFKIELGIDAGGKLVVADVIDNDSWRLRTRGWEEISKQLFRDNADFGVVADKYALVAEMVGRFKLPESVVIFWEPEGDEAVEWAGPKEDIDICSKNDDLFGGNSVIYTAQIYCGYKSPTVDASSLDMIHSQFIQQGVHVVTGEEGYLFAPFLAANSTWPVILAAPGNTVHVQKGLPVSVVMSLKSAENFALNILSLNNPYAYMVRQMRIEGSDLYPSKLETLDR